ncbi:MAG: hypothetical protein M3R59_09810 [Verrucomicrobiota bacterium]|nr:hypothetical protein [Verrucomicrobiota bacterium]MDQ2918809.1 hypothetical protein [Verrucomicrobiota bacterium]
MGEKKQQQQVGYETRDINVRVVAWVAVGFIISAIIMQVSLSGLFHLFKNQYPSDTAASRIVVPQALPPEPRLQTNPAVDLQQLRDAEDARLNRYGWIDKKGGVVRIPIERAMDLVVERGLPVRGPGTQNKSGKTPEQMQQEKAIATKP